jgi:hypothetical protein
VNAMSIIFRYFCLKVMHKILWLLFVINVFLPKWSFIKSAHVAGHVHVIDIISMYVQSLFRNLLWILCVSILSENISDIFFLRMLDKISSKYYISKLYIQCPRKIFLWQRWSKVIAWRLRNQSSGFESRQCAVFLWKI